MNPNELAECYQGKEGWEGRDGSESEDGYWCQVFVIWKPTEQLDSSLWISSEMITSLPVNCLATQSFTVNYAQTEQVFTVVLNHVLKEKERVSNWERSKDSKHTGFNLWPSYTYLCMLAHHQCIHGYSGTHSCPQYQYTLHWCHS